MKKRVALFYLLLLLGIPLFSQTSKVKDVRQTYLWDVTLSMQGKVQGCPDIWDKVKNAIISDIQQISDDRTEIVVIPFQHEALDTWREFATPSGKASLIKRIKEYEIPLYVKSGNAIVKATKGKGTTWTYLAPPLQYVVDNVLSVDKVDILKFMTDGEDEKNDGSYEAILEKWCEIAKEKDAYGFYIVLTDAAKKGKIVLEKLNPCRFDLVDLAELNGTNVSLLMLSSQQTIAFNVREDYNKNISIKFSHRGSGELPRGYKVHVYTEENRYVHVNQVVELHEDYSVTVKTEYLMSQTEMRESLSVETNEKVLIHCEPADGMDELPYLTTRILPEPTTMEMINKPEKTVKFHVL